MHDGVGSNLATAVRQLESGQAQAHQIVQSLRESMDYLKLSIDALNLPAGDVNALLASLRYRLQPRIESAGLQVEWNVEALPRWAAGGDEAMRHLQFLLLEVISNVLQHAQAATLGLGASAGGGDIRITLADDGRGIRATVAARAGSLQVRAAAIGALVSVEPADPGTRVTIVLSGGAALRSAR
jgi:signal transduction histidine kinase